MVPAESPWTVWHASSRDSVHALRREPREQHRSVFIFIYFFNEMTDRHFCSSSVCVRRCDVCLSPSAGEAVTFTRQYLLTTTSGRRPRVPGVVVIIADKRSADNLTVAANELRAAGVSAHLSAKKKQNNVAECNRLHLRRGIFCRAGVTVLAVGVDRADTEELRQAATGGSTQNVLYTRDAAQLDSLHTSLADLLCGLARTGEVRGNRVPLLCSCKSVMETWNSVMNANKMNNCDEGE